MRIVLMTLACTAGVIGQFFLKFPAVRDQFCIFQHLTFQDASLLRFCVLGYFLFSGITCVVDMLWMKSSGMQISDREVDAAGGGGAVVEWCKLPLLRLAREYSLMWKCRDSAQTWC